MQVESDHHRLWHVFCLLNDIRWYPEQRSIGKPCPTSEEGMRELVSVSRAQLSPKI
jgi:hypothetical protein